MFRCTENHFPFCSSTFLYAAFESETQPVSAPGAAISAAQQDSEEPASFRKQASMHRRDSTIETFAGTADEHANSPSKGGTLHHQSLQEEHFINEETRLRQRHQPSHIEQQHPHERGDGISKHLGTQVPEELRRGISDASGQHQGSDARESSALWPQENNTSTSKEQDKGVTPSVQHLSSQRAGTHAAPVAEGVRQPSTANQGKCNCKKSKCLQRYCECFQNGLFCGESCMCKECCNNEQNAERVKKAREQVSGRNKAAFLPKIIYVDENGEKVPRHYIGCYCKKSGCQKRYCECYQAGVPCARYCKCRGCKNCSNPPADCDPHPREVKEELQPQKRKRDDGPDAHPDAFKAPPSVIPPTYTAAVGFGDADGPALNDSEPRAQEAKLPAVHNPGLEHANPQQQEEKQQKVQLYHAHGEQWNYKAVDNEGSQPRGSDELSNNDVQTKEHVLAQDVPSNNNIRRSSTSSNSNAGVVALQQLQEMAEQSQGVMGSNSPAVDNPMSCSRPSVGFQKLGCGQTRIGGQN